MARWIPDVTCLIGIARIPHESTVHVRVPYIMPRLSSRCKKAASQSEELSLETQESCRALYIREFHLKKMTWICHCYVTDSSTGAKQLGYLKRHGGGERQCHLQSQYFVSQCQCPRGHTRHALETIRYAIFVGRICLWR